MTAGRSPRPHVGPGAGARLRGLTVLPTTGRAMAGAIALVAALATSCTARPVDATGASTGTTTATTAPADPTSTSASSSTTAHTSTGEPPTTSDADSDDTGCLFVDGCRPDVGGTPSDVGGPLECDVWTQDCPPGQKCMPYSGDGDNSWESLRCTQVAPNPGQVGDPCTTEGGGVSGIDTCEVGHMCWELDINGEGTCIKFCTGTLDMPVCDPGFACRIYADAVLILCVPTCDPLEQDCPETDLCLPHGPQHFICKRDASGDEGQEFDACEYESACDAGLVCLDPTLASECDTMAIGCCLSFCDLTNPVCNAQGAECLPWYPMGMAPNGYENLGFCGLPP